MFSYIPRFGHVLYDLNEELKAYILKLVTETNDKLIREALNATYRMTRLDEL